MHQAGYGAHAESGRVGGYGASWATVFGRTTNHSDSTAMIAQATMTAAIVVGVMPEPRASQPTIGEMMPATPKSRRKAMLLKLTRLGADRIHVLMDPNDL